MSDAGEKSFFRMRFWLNVPSGPFPDLRGCNSPARSDAAGTRSIPQDGAAARLSQVCTVSPSDPLKPGQSRAAGD